MALLHGPVGELTPVRRRGLQQRLQHGQVEGAGRGRVRGAAGDEGLLDAEPVDRAQQADRVGGRHREAQAEPPEDAGQWGQTTTAAGVATFLTAVEDVLDSAATATRSGTATVG